MVFKERKLLFLIKKIHLYGIPGPNSTQLVVSTALSRAGKFAVLITGALKVESEVEMCPFEKGTF